MHSLKFIFPESKVAFVWVIPGILPGRKTTSCILFTSGHCPRLDGGQDLSISDGVVDFGYGAERTSTGNAVMEGDDPTTLTLYSLGLSHASALPHHGRYPDGSLIHNGVRYYGTYCLDPAGQTKYGNTTYN